MIEWVHKRVRACAGIDRVIIATDDERIYTACEGFGAEVVMTDTEHASGTDRIAEAVRLCGVDSEIVLNVQGDEPTIQAADLGQLIALFNGGVDIGTLVCPIKEASLFEDSNVVKAVVAESGRALYFSRSPIPYDRSASGELNGCYQHIGVYAYKREVLAKICNLPQSPLERRESLEQLRWLEADYRIEVARVEQAPVGVDVPEDLARVKAMLA